MVKFLGIDYGSKKIGLAISDERGTIAFPKKILANEGHVFNKIKNITEKEAISEVVIGESLNFSGKPNKISKDIDSFVLGLAAALGLPIHKQKEFLTSVEARRYNEKSIVDDSAAALILQRYLDKINYQK